MKTLSSRMQCFGRAIGLSALSLVVFAARSQAVTLTFEDIAGMPNAGPAPIPVASRLFDQYLSTHGVVFTSSTNFISVVNIGAGATISGTNCIGGSTAAGFLTYSAANPIKAEFFDPANPFVLATTDFVSLRVDLFGSGLNVTLNAYDVSGGLIASHTTADLSGALLQVSTPGIHSVQFIGTTDSFGAGVDDFTFNAVTPVPEPSAAALLLSGTALLWFRRRR